MENASACYGANRPVNARRYQTWGTGRRFFCLWQAKEEPIDILQVPYQHLAGMLIRAAARARARAAKGTKVANRLLREVDMRATSASNKTLNEEEANAISTIRCSGGYAKVEQSNFDAIENTQCDYCNQGDCTVDHIIWEWCFLAETRKTTDEVVAKLPIATLHTAVKIGIATAMQCKHDATFWGQDAQTNEENKQTWL